MLAIDDWGHRANYSIPVQDHGIHRRITDYMKISSKVRIFLEEFSIARKTRVRSSHLVEVHYVLSCHLLSLVEGRELDLLGW